MRASASSCSTVPFASATRSAGRLVRDPSRSLRAREPSRSAPGATTVPSRASTRSHVTAAPRWRGPRARTRHTRPQQTYRRSGSIVSVSGDSRRLCARTRAPATRRGARRCTRPSWRHVAHAGSSLAVRDPTPHTRRPSTARTSSKSQQRPLRVRPVAHVAVRRECVDTVCDQGRARADAQRVATALRGRARSYSAW